MHKGRPWRSPETTAHRSVLPLEENGRVKTSPESRSAKWNKYTFQKYPNSPRCAWGPSQVWHRQVWLSPRLDREPQIDKWMHAFLKRRVIPFSHNPTKLLCRTTWGNSSLTRDMMRDVFPTLAVDGRRDKWSYGVQWRKISAQMNH